MPVPTSLARCLPALFVLIVPLFGLPAAGQETHHDPDYEHVSDQGVPLYNTLGEHNRPITTSSALAQAYFDNGLQLMYAFGRNIARLSFQAAREEDPGCAMCWWGEAWALAPYLNGGMGSPSEAEAYGLIQRAAELAGGSSPVEAALIQAMALRFSENPEPGGRAALDSVYADAMEEVAAEFPDDLDVQTLYAESRMLLRPRRGAVDLDDPSVQEITTVLEGILERNLRHPGACHLFIHHVEASQEPERAEACSDHLADEIPGASHIQHMPSHIYMQIGRYGDSVRGNLRARWADERAEYGGVPGIYPAHNLNMLIFAAVFDGQSAIAIRAAHELARMATPQSFFLPVTLTIFGKWDDVLELNDPPEDAFLEGMWRWARGTAHLRTGAEDAAADDLRRLREIEEETPGDRTFRFHPQRDLLAIARGILEAEVLAEQGDGDEAIRVVSEATRIYDALVYDEPEPWHLPPRLVLGHLLLEMDRANDAETAFREALDQHPRMGWALFGLERALRMQGHEVEADDVALQFEDAWSRSDTWLRSSRF